MSEKIDRSINGIKRNFIYFIPTIQFETVRGCLFFFHNILDKGMFLKNREGYEDSRYDSFRAFVDQFDDFDTFVSRPLTLEKVQSIHTLPEWKKLGIEATKLTQDLPHALSMYPYYP